MTVVQNSASNHYPTINFAHNFNNKLMCVSFTTIRLRDDQKYRVGESYWIYYQHHDPLGHALITDIKHFKLKQLTEFMAHIDTGYSKAQCIDIIKELYKEENVNWETQELSFILITQEGTHVRYITPSITKKAWPFAELFIQGEKIFSH